jgi:hypothetical protein
MAITYVGDLSTDRDKVRFYLQDTVEDSGPKPGEGNFTDAEVDGLVNLEGSWQRAVAAGLEALAVAWARYADLTVGPRKEALSQVAKRYQEQAREWRERYGSATMRRVYVAGQVRVDGYSDDVASDDVDTSSEYGADFEYVTPET